MTQFAPSPRVADLNAPHYRPRCKPIPVAKLSERESTLLAMLTYRRPADSDSELEFIRRFILPCGAQPDGFGNLWLDVPHPDGGPVTTLWSSHTDSVHHAAGKQSIVYAAGIVTLQEGEKGCLGADCAAGVFAMLDMIRARVPGRYAFHRQEESGGLGSNYVADHEPDRLRGITHAIALDRAGYSDVITHQIYRTASDAFAVAMAAKLNAQNPLFTYAECDGGVFTDTAVYKHLIPECTNLSVGYFRQHGPRESQDARFLFQLCDALIAIGHESLPVARDHTQPDSAGDWPEYGWGGGMEWRKNTSTPVLDLTRRNSVGGGAAPPARGFKLGAYDTYGGPTRATSRAHMAPHRLESFVYQNPGIVADFLADLGYETADLERFQDDMLQNPDHLY